MKIRVIEGEYHDLDGWYLSPVAFPMEEVYYGDDIDHPDTITITNETELREWAEEAFYSYEIYTMEVPEGAIVKEEEDTSFSVYAVGMDGDLYHFADFPNESEASYEADALARFNGRDAYAVPASLSSGTEAWDYITNQEER